MRFLSAFRVAALLPLVLVAGCAKVPDSGSSANGRFVNVTMTLRGSINPNYYYFVLINRTDNYNDAGPVPVVAPPWNNGFAAASQSNAQGFVSAIVFNNSLGGTTGYGIYNVPTDSTNKPTALPYQLGTGVNGFIPIGQPDQVTPFQTGDRTLSFRINLNRLPNPEANYILLNMIATNNLPSGVDPNSPKIWDALGDGTNTSDVSTLNTWIKMDITQGQYQSNSQNNTEPQGDVRDHLGPTVEEPSLDITDWTIQVLEQ